MTERPILFSAPMVRAILAGTKTQTRRIVACPRDTGAFVVTEAADGSWWPMKSCDGETGDDGHGNETFLSCPYGVPGDRLWVRETWRRSDSIGLGDYAHYRADEDEPPADGCWRPSIFMPRWASRITLEITGVRIERLQDISEEDARAEGVMAMSSDPGRDKYRAAYEYLWDTINAKRGYPWSSNPWVWAIEFRRCD